jgi:hypothetical protein
MSKWLGRLAFPFIILAAVLAWEGRHRENRTLYFAGAAVLGAAGIVGLRERHRRDE